MSETEIKNYLSYKRKFTYNRVLAIITINILAYIGITITLILNQYILSTVIISLLSIALTVYSIQTLIKNKKSVSQVHLSASITFLHTYIMFGIVFYVIVMESIDFHYYLLTYFFSSLLLLYVMYQYIKNRINSNKLPKRKYSELFWFLIIIPAVSLTKLLSDTPLLDSTTFKLIFIIIWLVVGTYSVADYYMNARLYQKLK